MIKILILNIAILLVLGCANQNKRLDSDSSEVAPLDLIRTSNVKVVSFIKQEGIQVQFKPSMRAQEAIAQGQPAAGLIGAIIDSRANKARKEQAEKNAIPYRDMLTSYNFEDEMKKSFSQTLKENGVNVTDFIVNPDFNTHSDLIRNLRVNFNEEKLLILNTSYSLGPDTNLLSINSTVELVLYQTDKKGRKISQTVFTQSEPEDIKKRRKSTKSKQSKETYETILWEVQFQSPRRYLDIKLKPRELVKQEIYEIEKRYDKKISESSHYGERKAWNKKKKQKLDTVYRRQILPLEKLERREPWVSESLAAELNRGVKRVSETILSVFGEKVSDLSFENKAIPIPIYDSFYQGYTMQDFLAEHDELENTRESIYISDSNKVFIAPTEEIIQIYNTEQ